MADLTVAYAFDMGDHYVFVANKDLPRLGVSAEELHERALQNLRALNLNVQAHSGEGIMALTAGGNYEATLLLLPEIWEAFGPLVEGRMIVSVPARDIVYVAGDSNQENLASLRRWTSKMLENADKPMSRTFLVWTGSGWTEYDGIRGVARINGFRCRHRRYAGRSSGFPSNIHERAFLDAPGAEVAAANCLNGLHIAAAIARNWNSPYGETSQLIGVPFVKKLESGRPTSENCAVSPLAFPSSVNVP